MGNSQEKSQPFDQGEDGTSEIKTPPSSSSDHADGLVPMIATTEECPVCLTKFPTMLRFSKCGHFACKECWISFVCTQISSFSMAFLTCVACRLQLGEVNVINLLSDTIASQSSNSGTCDDKSPDLPMLLNRYDEFLMRRNLNKDANMRWCPRGCGFGFIGIGFEACPRIICPSQACNRRSFCFRCSRPWTTDSTSDLSTSANHVCSVSDGGERNETVEGILTFFGFNRARRRSSIIAPHPQSPWRPNKQSLFTFDDDSASTAEDGVTTGALVDQSIRRASSSSSQNDPVVTSPTSIPLIATTEPNEAAKFEIKPCPRCGALIQKVQDGSCNHMVCSLCSYDFCWLCLRENTVDHYFNLSGCTVWGQRVWSTRRRFTVLLLLILLTPIVLPLVVVLCLPIISIVFSVLIGRHVYTRECVQGRFRCTIATLASLMSLLFTPFAAALLLVLLTLLILIYIYIYLPIQACRSLANPPPALPPRPSVNANELVDGGESALITASSEPDPDVFKVLTRHSRPASGSSSSN